MSDGIRPALEQVPWLPKAKGLAERIQQASANSHFATAGASYERIGLLETTIDHLKGRLADADEGSDAA